MFKRYSQFIHAVLVVSSASVKSQTKSPYRITVIVYREILLQQHKRTRCETRLNSGALLPAEILVEFEWSTVITEI